MNNPALIAELIKSGQNVNITLGAKDLREFADHLITATRRELEAAVISDKVESYLSPKQVSEKLSVDLSTLWLWNKKGYLTHSSVGGKRRYKLSEVMALLNKKTK
jgi:ribosomal protein L17